MEPEPCGAPRRDPADEASPGAVHRRLLAAVAERRSTLAFIALFGHFAPRIKAYMKKLGASDPDAEELAQEAMLAVWRSAASYDPARSAASSWIFTIARNLRIDALRRERRHALDLADPLLVPPDLPPADDTIALQQRQARLRLALLTLAPDQAEVIHLAFHDGLSHGAIAARLGLPLGTAKSRLRLATRRLRLALGDLDEAPAAPTRRAAA
ncbi:MAG TPA: sigma-70 family RNA polymerase sigma factor [Stellaceae bacterium]|nr:sigma-70 family RNA polymerase sigma factor [Stellaceae bacterium]